MSFCEDGILECGASVRIQSLLEKIKEFSLGGIEYLASVPSSVGGAVYMNAGRGRKIKRSISDYIESVRYLDIADMQIKNMYGNDGYLYYDMPKEKEKYYGRKFRVLQDLLLCGKIPQLYQGRPGVKQQPVLLFKV